MSFDKDRSGSIEAGEFSGALAQMGFNLSPKLVQVHYFVTRRIKWRDMELYAWNQFSPPCPQLLLIKLCML